MLRWRTENDSLENSGSFLILLGDKQLVSREEIPLQKLTSGFWSDSLQNRLREMD